MIGYKWILLHIQTNNEKEEFKEVIRQNWNLVHSDDVFVNFKIKIKKTKLALSKWSKECFGNIFKQLVIERKLLN